MAKEIIVKNKKQLDKIKKDFDGVIYLEGGTKSSPLILKIKYEYAQVIARGNAQIIMRGNSVVQYMWENSVVQDMRGNSVVQDMWENSVVQYMWENSVVQDMRGNSVVQYMWENSVVQYMWENSVVQDMRGNSVVQYMRGEAMVSAYGNNKIKASGYNIIRTVKSNRKNLIIVMNKKSHLIIVPDLKPTFVDFKKRFPVQIKGKNAILYKAVHKVNGRYFSDNTTNFEYKIGEIKKHKNNKSKENSCSFGLHIAEKRWALTYGKNWEDMALLECRVPTNKIVVAKDCDGKVRTSELRVLREVPKEEW